MTIFAFSERLEAGVNARFLLQALASHKTEILARPFRVKEVSRLFCLTEKLVREAAVELVDRGFLLLKKNDRKVGRPRLEYEASPYLMHVIAEERYWSEWHEKLVLRIFSKPDIYASAPGLTSAREKIRKDGRPAAPGADGHLGVSTKMLLAALLISADQCGVVAGLGEAKLQAMTGMNSAALKHQIKRLIALGFIFFHVPGASNKVFTCTKIPTTYYLNLGHSCLRGYGTYEFAIVLLNDFDGGYKRLLRGLSPEVENAFLSLGSAVMNIFCQKLSDYTAHGVFLLSQRGDKTDENILEILKEMADKEIRGVWIENPKAGGEPELWKDVTTHFSTLAFEWADFLVRRFYLGEIPAGLLFRPVPTQHENTDSGEVFIRVLPKSAPEIGCPVRSK